MIKKGVCLLMALALCLTLPPASALAAEAQGQAGQEQTVLTQGNDGQTQAPGQDGAGEDDKTSDEAPDKAPDEEPDEAVSAVQALIDAQKAGAFPNGEIALVMASNQKAYALERAKNAGIESVVVSRKSFVDPADYDRAVVETLQSRGIELVVLAGFLSILGKPVIEAYPERILNIHPSLIPSFCGVGYYGLHVHEKALARGVRVTGATVHFVDTGTDTGPIILQKAVKIKSEDTPEVVQRRVMEKAEWKILPKAINLIANGKVKVVDGRVEIEEYDTEE